MQSDRVLTAFMAWARGEPKRRAVFIRGGAGATRVFLDSWDDWLDAWRRFSDYDWFLTVEPQNYIERNIASRLFLDVDRRGCADIVKKRLKESGVEYWALESGRGLHIYVEFTPVKLASPYRSVMRSVAKSLLGDAYRCVDEQALKNNATGRPPFTLNTRAGKRVCLESAGDCWDESFTPPVNRWLAGYVASFDREQSGSGIIKRVAPGYFKERSFRDWPPCIQEMVKRLVVEGELEHIARVHLASFLLRVGVSPHSVFRMANDYREWVTQYQSDHVRAGKYYVLSCRRVAELGYCPYYESGGEEAMRRCPFYPWLEVWLPKWEEEGD